MPVLKVKTQVSSALRGAVEKKYHDETAIKDVIDYVIREDKSGPELIGGIAVNPQMAQTQFEIVAQAYGKDFGVRLRHMILSFSPGEGIDFHAAKDIAYRVSAYYGYHYQIIWAVHTDGRNIHIHMVMNTVSYRTGMKYDGSKADYYRFQTHINGILAPYDLYVVMVNDQEEL